MGRPKNTDWEKRGQGKKELSYTKYYYVPATGWLITSIDDVIWSSHFTDVKTEEPERVSDLPGLHNHNVDAGLLDPKSWALPIEGGYSKLPLSREGQ